jgi:ribonuclease PH
MTRKDGRSPHELRHIEIIRNYQKYPEGSVLIKWGDTWVLCNASVQPDVPPFLDGREKGWITAEYSMLPRATNTRNSREKNRMSGRTAEIKRLIGRSLRAVVDLSLMPGYTVIMDCDVLQADGGTRTASISGSFVALWDACQYMINEGLISKNPIIDSVAGLSLGIVGEDILVDLNYREDSSAEVDMNVVFTGNGDLVEIQGTAEGAPFARDRLNSMLDVAHDAVQQIFRLQKESISK